MTCLTMTKKVQEVEVVVLWVITKNADMYVNFSCPRAQDGDGDTDAGVRQTRE